jgi:DNA-binding beta-propeller fold protein YncE
MKKLLTVSLVALVTLNLLMLRGTTSAVAAAQAASYEPARLQLIQRIPLPRVSGRIDHFLPHSNADIVIFAALGNDSVEIVNAFKGKLVQSLKGLDEPQGVLYVPGFDKIFTANAGNGTVKVYDAKTYAPRKSIALGEKSDTDNLRYDEASKRVFVGIVGGIAMIDPANETRVGDLKGTGGHSESSSKKAVPASSSMSPTMAMWSMSSTGRPDS